MTTQDSDSEITGRVAASLTPPVVRARPARGDQSSGFFDLDTLYAIHVEQVRPPPLGMPPPLPVVRPVARPVPRALPVEVDAVAPRARRPQPIGWYAIFVTWLVTTMLATLAATQLPAHGTMHARPLTATPTATPTSTPTASSPPVLSVLDLPRALPPARRAVPRMAAPAPSPEPIAAPATQTTQAAPAPAPAKPAPAATPASTGNSLEDLIRREVAAEQKRLHPPATR